MKSYYLFCYLLVHIAACIFALKAHTTPGIVTGYLAVMVSMALLSNTVLSKMFTK